MDTPVPPSQSSKPAVRVHLPTVLRDYCGGTSELTVKVSDVRALLVRLERERPALYRCICDDAGAIRRHINVFVNSSHILDCAGLDTRLESGDSVTILPAVSGG